MVAMAVCLLQQVVAPHDPLASWPAYQAGWPAICTVVKGGGGGSCSGCCCDAAPMTGAG